jgi:hypothetical protein
MRKHWGEGPIPPPASTGSARRFPPSYSLPKSGGSAQDDGKGAGCSSYNNYKDAEVTRKHWAECPSVFLFDDVFSDELALPCHSVIAVPNRVSESQ